VLIKGLEERTLVSCYCRVIGEIGEEIVQVGGGVRRKLDFRV
jgi:hypothetical protein